jgi:hypothetical protein
MRKEIDMRKQWWASRNGKQLGPFDSRDEAFEEYILRYPSTDFVTTGYGSIAPDFDVKVHEHHGYSSLFAQSTNDEQEHLLHLLL